MKEKILFTNLVEDALDKVIAEIDPAGVFVMADTNTAHRHFNSIKVQLEPVNP